MFFLKACQLEKVVDVKVDQYGLNQTAYLEPTTDFYDLSDVMVVKRSVASEEEEIATGGDEEQ